MLVRLGRVLGAATHACKLHFPVAAPLPLNGYVFNVPADDPVNVRVTTGFTPRRRVAYTHAVI